MTAYRRLPASTSVSELCRAREEGWDVVVWVGWYYLLSRSN